MSKSKQKTEPDRGIETYRFIVLQSYFSTALVDALNNLEPRQRDRIESGLLQSPRLREELDKLFAAMLDIFAKTDD